MRDDPLSRITVVIPTLDRPTELARCLASLKAQTEVSHEVILITKRGPLAQLRNEGLRQTHTPVVSFIDDDVVCPPGWLAGVLRAMAPPTVVGVTGPAGIPQAFWDHRDLFKYTHLRRLHDCLFVDARSPGVISRAGTFNTLAAEEGCLYEGRVDYLEACNMSFKTETLNAVGGFDEAYGGIGDWSEPDVCYRLRVRYGNDCLWFSPTARLEHQPSCRGAYLLRDADARQRLANYRLFSRRWVAPTLRNRLYHLFLWSYYSTR